MSVQDSWTCTPSVSGSWIPIPVNWDSHAHLLCPHIGVSRRAQLVPQAVPAAPAFASLKFPMTPNAQGAWVALSALFKGIPGKVPLCREGAWVGWSPGAVNDRNQLLPRQAESACPEHKRANPTAEGSPRRCPPAGRAPALDGAPPCRVPTAAGPRAPGW